MATSSETAMGQGTVRRGLSTALLRVRFFEPASILWVLLILFLLFLVASPFAHLLVVSFEKTGGDGFTLANYVTAYSRSRYLDGLRNSLMLGLATAVVCVAFALPMAWAVSRTNMPAKWLVWGTVLGAFILPPYLTAIGWILLAGPNAGWLNRMWMAITGAESGLFDIYTFTGIVLVIALNAFPYVFLFTKSALDLVSTEMEEAANILGANAWQATWKVTLPLIWPAILGSIIIVFLEAIALFGVPALLGIPARINFVTTQLWEFFGFPLRMEVAAAYSMPLLLITLLLIYAQRLLLSRKGYVSQTGKGGERRPIDIGPWRFVLLGYCTLIGVLAVAAPAYVIVQASFSKAWGRAMSWDNFTVIHYWQILFEQSMTQQAIMNSFMFAAAAAFLAIGLALAIAYLVTRRLVPWGNVLAFLCMAPFVIPGIILAIGFYAAYATPPVALYGTATLMILAFAARFLPIAYATSAAGMRSINPEMEEAVRILGGGRLTAIRAVVAPLLKKTLLGGWLLVFIPATRELSAAIFLVGPQTRVMSVLIYDMSEEGNFELVSALGGIILIATSFFVWLGFKLVGRDFMLRGR
ncbi:MAG: ABC transporter permease subunit [Alphaproteobacteria bacterium]|nr:ABC transporter permease subunit [Alphaproteobacteria bacterium]